MALVGDRWSDSSGTNTGRSMMPLDHDDHHHEDELITDRFRIHIGPNMIKVILALALLIAVIMGDSINPSQFF